MVPFQIASSVGISLGLVDTILADREILRAANLSFLASALALQGYMIYREVTNWLMFTVPLIRGQIRNQGALTTLLDFSILTALATYTTLSMLHVPEVEAEVRMATFLLGVRINLVFAGFIIVSNSLLCIYNVINRGVRLWRSQNRSYEERLYTEASEAAPERIQLLTEASTAFEGPSPVSSNVDGPFDKTSLFNDDISCSEMSSAPNLNALIDREKIEDRIQGTWVHPGNAVLMLAKRMALNQIPTTLECAHCKLELRK